MGRGKKDIERIKEQTPEHDIDEGKNGESWLIPNCIFQRVIIQFRFASVNIITDLQKCHTVSSHYLFTYI